LGETPIVERHSTLATAETTISKDFLEHLLDVDKLKYCYECGICTGACPMTELLGKDYNPRSLLGKIMSDPDTVLASDDLWLCAWCYRCHRRCNQALKLPEIFLSLRRIAAQRGVTKPYEAAFRKIAEKVPLPLAAALACFHPERAGLDRDQVLERIWQMHEDYLKSEKAKRAQVVSEEQLTESFPSPKKEETLKYMRAGKGVILCICSKKMSSRGEVQSCCSQAESKLAGKAEYINIDLSDPKEAAFIKELKVDPSTSVPVTFVINPQGQVTGKYDGEVQVTNLVEAATKVVKSGCCPPGSGKTCGPTTIKKK
jgi:heterodisulfide reductase subunit C